MTLIGVVRPIGYAHRFRGLATTKPVLVTVLDREGQCGMKIGRDECGPYGFEMKYKAFCLLKARPGWNPLDERGELDRQRPESRCAAVTRR